MDQPFDIEVATKLLEGAGERLQQHKWFSTDWLFSVHQFPPAPQLAEAVTLHVYRPGWFNEDRQGIHFETFIGPKEWKKRQLPIMMHIFHGPHVPGTKIARRKIAQPFVDEVYDLVSSWNGYEFRAGRYGTHPFTCVLDVDFDNIDQQLEREFSRLCRQLGPIMDETLDTVLDRK